MTYEQKRGLKADVLGEVRDRVECIFVDFQNALQVETGDVDPIQTMVLENAQDQLAQIITAILITQKGE